MAEQVGDIVRMPDGTEYRACIEREPDQDKPYDDGQWPILRVRYRGWDGWQAEAFNSAAEPYVDAFNRLTPLGGYKMEVFERFVRIFHGANYFHEYGPNQETDYTYFAFDPAEWRERVLGPGVDLSQEKPLAEVIAWVEGDVYCSFTQKRWNPDETLEPDEGWEDMHEDDGTTWGLYGRDAAETVAAENLTADIRLHEPVYRYPEHEKIAAHQAEIDAILEFLEAPRGPAEIMGRALAGKDQIALCRMNDRLQWWPVGESDHQRIVFEHFGIDYAKIQAERELIYQRLTEKETNAGT